MAKFNKVLSVVKIIFCTLCSLTISAVVYGATANYTLADKGKSSWRIVVSADASPSEKYAATELQKFLKEISNAELPIATDEGQISEHEVILGDNAHLRSLKTSIDFAKLGDEGFTIRTEGNHLVIAGGRLCGTLYGVYTFLEEYLGCRWYSSKVSYIPKLRKIAIGAIDDTQVPALEYREVFYYDAFDGDWAARNKANSPNARLIEQHGGKYPWAFPTWHTFDWLVPQDKYFKEHPEYFALIGDKRSPTQLCLTNPDVLKLVTERVQQWMRELPAQHLFSVSQNDNNGYCQCPNCKALDEREGSPQGSLLTFVNAVADAIKDEFPANRILTFAYAYSLTSPKTLRPNDNVIIHIAMMGYWPTCARSLVQWSKVTDRIILWDYVTGFTHFTLPYPNLYKLQPDIKFYVQNGVRGVMSQGNYLSPGGEFAELRAYLLAKLLWNPNCNVDAIIDDFVKGYYGKAGAVIREYINLLHTDIKELNNVSYEEMSLIVKERAKQVKMNPDWEGLFSKWWIYPFPNIYLNPERIAKYETLFQQAEQLVANEPDVLLRVQVAHLPIQMIQIETMTRHDPKRAKVIERYFAVASNAGITHFGELTDMKTYKARVMKETASP